MSLKELNDLLEKPVFVNPELEQPISLQDAARNRYSDMILSQVYKMDFNLDITDANKKDNKIVDLEKKEENKKEAAAPSKLITF